MARLVAIDAVSPAAVEALLDEAFGPGRHGRTAYKLRAGTQALPALSFAVVGAADELLGSIQCWPVRFVGEDGSVAPLVLVGPVAVAPAYQQGGLGRRLMEASLAAADAHGLDLMLIGDPAYYGRFFGFDAARTGLWRLPGPVERHRLLARGDNVPAGAGTIEPRVAVQA